MATRAEPVVFVIDDDENVRETIADLLRSDVWIGSGILAGEAARRARVHCT
jgi:hypothetical protein